MLTGLHVKPDTLNGRVIRWKLVRKTTKWIIYLNNIVIKRSFFVHFLYKQKQDAFTMGTTAYRVRQVKIITLSYWC